MVAVFTVVTMAAMATDVITDFLLTLFLSVTKTPSVPMAPFFTMAVAITSVQGFLWLLETPEIFLLCTFPNLLQNVALKRRNNRVSACQYERI